MKKRSSFVLMIKPIGPVCNLSCDYCYYLEKANLYTSKQPLPTGFRMPLEVLEKSICDYMDSQETEEILFTWQGGEPTMLGIDFFKKVIAIEYRYARGRRVSNSIQTNGTMINGEWAEFLARNNFLVGLSIDGPNDLHNHYRKFPSGKGSFSRVMDCVDLFHKHNVAFNTITTVNNRNSRMPLRTYKFLKDLGSRYMQFIPIVERETEDKEGRFQPVLPDTMDAWVTEESVEPMLWGKFLSRIFDEWVRTDIGRYYVNYFDNTLAPYVDEEPQLCTTQLTCGAGPVMEHNGDVYACDHYVYPDFLLGNVMDVPLGQMMNSSFQADFGLEKQNTLPGQCLDCEFLKMCGGDCPKHRFVENGKGERISYLHEGFLYFFRHVDKYMKMMAAQIKQQKPAETILNRIPERQKNSVRNSGKSIP